MWLRTHFNSSDGNQCVFRQVSLHNRASLSGFWVLAQPTGRACHCPYPGLQNTQLLSDEDRQGLW